MRSYDRFFCNEYLYLKLVIIHPHFALVITFSYNPLELICMQVYTHTGDCPVLFAAVKYTIPWEITGMEM